MNRLYKTFTIGLVGICFALSTIESVHADTQSERLYFQELQSTTVDTKSIGYSIKRGFEKIEGVVMFSNNAKTGYYYKLGVKRLSDGVGTQDIELINEGKLYFSKSREYAKKTNNEDIFKQSDIYISQIDRYSLYLEYFEKYNQQVGDVSKKTAELSQYIDDAYKFKEDKVSEDNMTILLINKSKLSQYATSVSSEYNNFVLSSLKSTETGTFNATDVSNGKQICEIYFKDTTTVYDKAVEKVENLKKFVSINPMQLKEVVVEINKSESVVKEKMGTLDLRDTVVEQNSKLILDEFYKETSQYLSELQTSNNQLFSDHVISKDEENKALSDKRSVIDKIKQSEGSIVDKLEKLRTTDKYDLIMSLIASNNKLNIELIDKTYTDNYTIVKDVTIDGLSMDKAIKTVYKNAKDSNSATYSDVSKKIKELLSTKQKTQKIDTEISTVMESFRINASRDAKFAVSEMKSIENITDYYVTESAAIYSLEESYKRYNNMMFERLTKDKYYIEFSKNISDFLISQYKEAVLDSWVKAVGKEIHKIIDQYKTYSEANMALDRSQELLHSGYKIEHDRIPSYWKSVYSVYEDYKKQMQETEKASLELEKYYSDQRSKIEKYQFLRYEALNSFDSLYNKYLTESVGLITKFQYELLKTYLSMDKKLDDQYTEARNLINALKKDMEDLTKQTKDSMIFVYEYSNILNQANIDMTVSIKQVNDVASKNLITVGTNKTYIVEEYTAVTKEFGYFANEHFDILFLSMYGNIPSFLVIDNKQPMSKFQEMYTDYKETLDMKTKDTMDILNTLSKTELDMRLYIDNANHLRNSSYQVVEKKISDKNITNLQNKTAIADILNDYTTELSDKIKKHIEIVNGLIHSGQPDSYIQGEITKTYIPELEALTDLYMNKIDEYIKSIS